MRKYASKKSDIPTTAAQTAAQAVSDNPGIPMSSMRAMLMQKAMNDRSHRIDLPAAMQEKMERAFGMNFGKVNLYESESVADAGANAIAQGGSIAFAPGKADFNSLDGQRRLGHELSHIASQARGEATGSGFLDNGALEARADREGALAAAGEQVYSGAAMDAPSFAGASAPMQAQPGDDDVELPPIPLNRRPKQKGKKGRNSSVPYKLKKKPDILDEIKAMKLQSIIQDKKLGKENRKLRINLNNFGERSNKQIQAGLVRKGEKAPSYKNKPMYRYRLGIPLNGKTDAIDALDAIGRSELVGQTRAFKMQTNNLLNNFGAFPMIKKNED